MKAATSTTKNRASNNDDEESLEATNDDDSNSVEAVSSHAKKRNGKPTSTDAGASGTCSSVRDIRWSHVSHLFVGDPDESGDYDEEDDDNSDDEGTYNVLRRFMLFIFPRF